MTILPLSDRLASRIDMLFRPLRQRNVHARLTRIGDHLLSDMGISPADVEAMRRIW
jgi:uncharacterized protein YjiS (DUF1127 family)